MSITSVFSSSVIYVETNSTLQEEIFFIVSIMGPTKCYFKTPNEPIKMIRWKITNLVFPHYLLVRTKSTQSSTLRSRTLTVLLIGHLGISTSLWHPFEPQISYVFFFSHHFYYILVNSIFVFYPVECAIYVFSPLKFQKNRFFLSILLCLIMMLTLCYWNLTSACVNRELRQSHFLLYRG